MQVWAIVVVIYYVQCYLFVWLFPIQAAEHQYVSSNSMFVNEAVPIDLRQARPHTSANTPHTHLVLIRLHLGFN